MAIVLWSRISQPCKASILSFRLSFWIGLANMFWCIQYIILRSDEIVHSLEGQLEWFIRVMAFAQTLFPVWIAMLIFCIVFDVHLTVIHEFHNMSRYYRWYALTTFLFAFIFNIPNAIVIHPELIHWDSAHGWPIQVPAIQYIFTVTIWIGGSILYSVAVILLTLHRMSTSINRLKKLDEINEAKRLKEKRLFNTLLRILLYPVVFIVTQTSGLVAMLTQIVTRDAHSSTLYVLFNIDATLLGLSGVLNLMAFLINPSTFRFLSGIPWLANYFPFKKKPENSPYVFGKPEQRRPVLPVEDEISFDITQKVRQILYQEDPDYIDTPTASIKGVGSSSQTSQREDPFFQPFH
ncbi:uncharacterized protein VTP21DRAFT_7665 [Calcarisporiella thermophila]|uniref:uncharacterized protein n=1 Tax=Calcarisporiella thermophila TaxID=911321 RepID=UPI0037440E88